MSTIASFASAATAALLTPSGSVPGYWLCLDNARWDGGYAASVLSRFDEGYADQGTIDFSVTGEDGPDRMSLVSVRWSNLPVTMESLPPPEELTLRIRTPRRMKGGTLLLVPAEGALLPIPVGKAAMTWLKGSIATWVKVADPAQRSRLIERGGWRFAVIDSRGRVAAQGPVELPERRGMEIRYRPLAESLRAKAAAYETACQFEPQTETR